MAGMTGLEPATSCVTGRRSNQLSYIPALRVFFIMAGMTGLEPATSCVTGRRSNQLSYIPYFSVSLCSSHCEHGKTNTVR